MKGDQEFLAFNRGLVSRFALARADLQKLKLAADRFVNWMARALGSMSLRPGLGYLGATSGNLKSKSLPFVFSSTDTARLEITEGRMRVWVDDALVTRPSVSTAFTNGSFPLDIIGWTDASEAGGSISWVSGDGYLALVSNGESAAIARQTLTVAGGDQNVEHALRVVVERGPVTLRVGSTLGGAEYIRDFTLGKGEHSLTFTPTGASAYVQLSSRLERIVMVNSIEVEPSGVMSVGTPWLEDDLSMLRTDQSGDVVYVACAGYQQRKIERRSTRSWSVVAYQPLDGPFLLANVSTTTLTASVTDGNGTLTASAPVFRATHVGALFRLTSAGQLVEDSLGGLSQSTDPIRVTGVGEARAFSYVIAGTFTGTLTLQRAISAPTDWSTVTTVSAPADTSYNDGLDNQVIYYRFTFTAYTSGSADVTLSHAAGSITGVARVTGYTSETLVSVEVLSALGGTTATDNWAEGRWSDFRGWPSAVALDGGRLWWAGKDRFNGSVSDAYESFDPDYEGDAGPISRSIGAGPVDNINWLMSLQRLLAGTDGSVVSVRSSSLDEPLTATNFNPKVPSTQGSARVGAVKIDSAVMFVQQSGKRVFQMDYSLESNDYRPGDLSAIIPEIGDPGIVHLAVQRQPDTRLHALRSDGTVAILVFDAAEDVKCWLEFETDGFVEDICVLPGTEEDSVVYTVRRTINGATVRYHEKWASWAECAGGTLNRQADSFVYVSQASSTTVAGLSHLEGEDVIVWQDGVCPADEDNDPKTYIVTGGEITLDTAAEEVIVGLPYTAQWRSAKLAYVIDQGFSGLTKQKGIDSIGVLLVDTHPLGLRYGRDFNTLDDLPQVVDGETVDQDTMIDAWDQKPVSFGGVYGPDSRLCLQGQAPRPCTVLAAIIKINSNP